MCVYLMYLFSSDLEEEGVNIAKFIMNEGIPAEDWCKVEVTGGFWPSRNLHRPLITGRCLISKISVELWTP